MGEKWTERTFRFDLPVGRFPFLLERLRGTAARIEEKLRGIPRERLIRRAGESWSAMENVGHLTDLEELHLARLDELAAGTDTLRAADMANKRTWEANHNAKPASQVIAEFRASRGHLLDRLESWDPARLDVAAMHPRLNMPMRVIDLAYFTAEHDDYHLARAHELLTMYRAEGD